MSKMFVTVSFVVFLTFSSLTNANSNVTEEKSDVLESWMKLDKTLKSTTHSVMKHLMPMLIESTGQVNLSSECMKQSLQFVTGLRNLKKWAFSFVDSSAKTYDGLLSGTLTSFGEYDQCLETTVPHSKNKDKILFQGQYCMVELRPPLPPKTKRYRMYDQLEELKNFNGSEVLTFASTRAHLMYYIPISAGLCIPSGCTENDLTNILSFAVKKLDMDVYVSHCEKKEEKSFDWIQIFAIIILCCLAFLVIAGTCMEKYLDANNTYTKNLGGRILMSFSASSNFKRLFSTKITMDNFGCLHGLRFLTITWVVYGHTYLYSGMFLSNYRSLFRVVETATMPVAQMILNGSEAVDSFLFMGGLLVSYLTIKRVKLEKEKFNILQFFVHRYFRIAPVLYFVILCSFLIPLMGSGPVFEQTMQNSVYPCYNQWWRNLLFVNNFFDSYKSCWKMTWYLSCDIQLYLISVIVILPMIWFSKIGIMINALIIALSVIYTGIVSYLYDISPSIVVTHMSPDDEYFFFVYTYANTLSRAGPYFIGVFTGYLLVTKPGIKIPKIILIFGWCLATLSSGMIIFAMSIWYRVHSPTPLESLLYAATYKVAFTAGIAWMTFCCITGYGGFINTFLSWKVWIPLGRLAFLTYLIQPVLQMCYISNFRIIQELTHLHFALQFFGYLCISMLLAFVANLLVESPFSRLEKLLFESQPKTEEKPKINGHKNIGFKNDVIKIKVNGRVDILTLENGTANMNCHNEKIQNNHNEKIQI